MSLVSSPALSTGSGWNNVSDVVNKVQEDVVRVIAGKKKLGKEKRKRIDHAFKVAKERMKCLVGVRAPRPVDADSHNTSDEEDPDGTAGPGGRGREGRGRGREPPMRKMQ